MTPGEQAIWAAVYARALRERERVYLDQTTGEPMPARPTKSTRLLAMMDAAEAVQNARDSFATFRKTPPAPIHVERFNQAMEMLSDMLGIDTNEKGPYR